jgi:ribA/ribD-fused uncharacterized protein
MGDYDRRWLEHTSDTGHPRLLFFWGHQPPKEGGVSVSCFSQWWPASFEEAGERYPTAEHWMMAKKARLFGDETVARAILAAPNPKAAKELGRAATGFDAALWEANKRRIVTEGNELKFRQNPSLAAFLLSTGDAVLVEASPVDPIWGIGLAANDPGALDARQWRGENLLGFILMNVRDRLRG